MHGKAQREPARYSVVLDYNLVPLYVARAKVCLLSVIYSSSFTSNGSKNSKINRQIDRRKQTVSLNKEQTNYIGLTVYKIPKKCKIKVENRTDVI